MPRAAAGRAPIEAGAMLEALRRDAGCRVDGATEGPKDAAPPSVAPLGAPRADAVRCAWTGSQLHGGLEGLLSTGGDADLALLVGDWCYAQALRILAGEADLAAIGVLAGAIGECASLLGAVDDARGARERIWHDACAKLAPGDPEGAR